GYVDKSVVPRGLGVESRSNNIARVGLGVFRSRQICEPSKYKDPEIQQSLFLLWGSEPCKGVWGMDCDYSSGIGLGPSWPLVVNSPIEKIELPLMSKIVGPGSSGNLEPYKNDQCVVYKKCLLKVQSIFDSFAGWIDIRDSNVLGHYSERAQNKGFGGPYEGQFEVLDIIEGISELVAIIAVGASPMSGTSFAKFLQECVRSLNNTENCIQISVPDEYESVVEYVDKSPYNIVTKTYRIETQQHQLPML
ncbi:5577_t:CDS:2, partial [Dentiscutata erythropus]